MSLTPCFTFSPPLYPPTLPHITVYPDNTAGIHTQRSGFNRHEQNVYFLPILVVDSGSPSLSSTGTLTIHVCGCDTGESDCRRRTTAEINITVTFCISSIKKKVTVSLLCLANSSYRLICMGRKTTQAYKFAAKWLSTEISGR